MYPRWEMRIVERGKKDFTSFFMRMNYNAVGRHAYLFPRRG